mmetsp:Transcript_12792/g.18361  ORF Transcript_12792/g.18361 Transcript_12792/m.18361 type:complete len:210 (+) Transcript_12792:86-715(+)|eukprot:CAMPEP_0172423544 /NCGR_PEP_ID=MMETSP1064-20121228/17375_1 /TAXON_ID=202472 /ORGANISM="Aulacoseira subarctica , Strain CCAP 1002/5" /LENGTH=209 /DNA_ID=CAMNT_0013164969 /DNA_START=85 /DNA_END=714 /DNA_ORIENTATION=+
MPTESTEAEQKTIRFDVGGQLYRISKSLIEQHEDTMLARLVSDTWLADPDATIFIDRDGGRFKNVLDYLRYGKVSLPFTVPLEMFLLDMEYYGFNSVDNDTARSTLNPSQIDDNDANKQAMMHIRRSFLTAQKDTTTSRTTSMILEKAMEYALLYVGLKSSTTPLEVYHHVSGKDGSEELAKSTQFNKYLNENRQNNHEVFNCGLAIWS